MTSIDLAAWAVTIGSIALVIKNIDAILVSLGKACGWLAGRIGWHDAGPRRGGQYRDRTCDPYHVKVVLYR